MSNTPYPHQHPGQNDGSQPPRPAAAAGAAGPVLRPPAANSKQSADDAAVAMIRQKLAAIYADEPDARQELTEAAQPDVNHSRHQRFMLELQASGKSADQIQAGWHEYYANLDDNAKHEVWQEFYSHSAEQRQRPSHIQPVYQPDLGSQSPAGDVTGRQPLQPVTAQPAVSPGHGDNQPSATAYNPLYGTPPSGFATAGTSADFSTPAAGAAPGSAASPAVSQYTGIAAASGTPAAGADSRTAGSIRAELRRRISGTGSGGGRLRVKHHFQSLLFGLGFGALTLLIVLFGFFNEVVIAPFIQPSRHVSATPIIADPNGVIASDKNEVIIPKINVQIPLVFDAKTTEEKEFDAALDRGVTHYPTTALPGQKGNAAFFGHSSNNIFNPGKYKFAFVLLNDLVEGDTFYINYNGVSYAYQVYQKKIVEATAVDILNPVADKPATAMLVTCDPPGTSLRRLAVWGVQVSPNPNGNSAASDDAAAGRQTSSPSLPGNGPTLWRRLWNSISGH